VGEQDAEISVHCLRFAVLIPFLGYCHLPEKHSLIVSILFYELVQMDLDRWHSGKCCTGKPGFVWLLEEDIQNISKFLKISREEFVAKVSLRHR
jgi:hypothetical protein